MHLLCCGGAKLEWLRNLWGHVRKYTCNYHPSLTLLCEYVAQEYWQGYVRVPNKTKSEMYMLLKDVKMSARLKRRWLCNPQLFLIDDGAPLAYPRHYRGVYMGVEHIQRVRELSRDVFSCESSHNLGRRRHLEMVGMI